MLARIANAADKFRRETEDYIPPLAVMIGFGLTVWLGTVVPFLVAVLVSIAYLAAWFFHQKPDTPRSSIKTAEPEPDELREWLTSNDLAAKALAFAGVFSPRGSARLSDEVRTLERTLSRVSDGMLDRIEKGIEEDLQMSYLIRQRMLSIRTYADRDTVRILRDAATKWLKQQQLDAVPDGFIDIDDIPEMPRYILNEYRLATNLIVMSLANHDLPEETSSTLTHTLAEMAYHCKDELEAWQSLVALQAQAAAEDALVFAQGYLDKSLVLERPARQFPLLTSTTKAY